MMNRLMNRKTTKKKIDFLNIKIWELSSLLEPWELGAILTHESNSADTDIMLDNMLEYFLKEEMYEYACVIRDEVNRRK